VPICNLFDDPEVAEDIRSFDCGHDPWAGPLNNYLRNGNAQREHLAQVASTYLIYSEDGQLVGYITLAWAVIDATQDLKRSRGLRRVPYSVLPALLLSRLAIQAAWQSRGFGTETMEWLRKLTGILPVDCRFIALHVDQANAAAVRFYERHGSFAHGSPNERGLLLM
jgi:GNAT superfamily N-acetyltransferase